MSDAGIPPDPWQADLLRCEFPQILLNCSRQAGKSRTAAAVALKAALLEPGSLILFLSPTERQSGELFLKMIELYRLLGKPVKTKRRKESEFTLELVTGSRIVGLPGKEGSIRCYSSVRLLVIDEAARVLDDLYVAVRPMLAVSGGRLIALSSPFGRRGWFFDEWKKDPAPWRDDEFCRQSNSWRRYRVPAWKCPRISAEFLEQERRAIGERWFRQEYGCCFEETIDAVFNYDDVIAAAANTLPPLFRGTPCS
jgi:hypothetical protein